MATFAIPEHQQAALVRIRRLSDDTFDRLISAFEHVVPPSAESSATVDAVAEQLSDAVPIEDLRSIISTLLAVAQAHRPIDTSDSEAARDEVQSRFSKYMRRWRRETWFMSSVKKRTANINYLSIISLGRTVIPLILRELDKQGDHWFLALRVLADEDVADDSQEFSEQRTEWLRWGKAKGYI